MLNRIVLIALLCASMPAWAEKLFYEIYSLDLNGKQTLLAKGVKEYTDSDIQIESREYRGKIHWSKSLALEKEFGIGASIYREPEITGFGIKAKGSPCGFSWEWFNVLSPGKFKKLQESGEVSVAYREIGNMKEIAEIHFDTDISLRLNESKEVGKETHRILIKKGSVLKLPPNNAFQGTASLTRRCP